MSLTIGEENITSTDEARNIGVTFDSHLSLVKHIRKTSKSAWFNIWNISKIRKFLDLDATKGLCHALVTSKLDFCNSLLLGTPDVHLKSLVKIQNASVRLICGLKKDTRHITPYIRNLHWLPLKFRIEFKILLLVYKALKDQAPPYLKAYLKWYDPGRSLR